jgi:hypothetical protein
MSLIDNSGKRVIEPGEFLINIAGGQRGGVNGRFSVSGKELELDR